MSDGSIQLLVGDPSTCTVSISVPDVFESSTRSISSCTLYHDKGPEPWLCKASSDAWLSTGIAKAIDRGGSLQDQGDTYCIVCYESGTVENFEVPTFKCVFSVEKFVLRRTHLVDAYIQEPSKEPQKFQVKSEDATGQIKKEPAQNMKVVKLAMQRWLGRYSRLFLFAVLTDGTMLCYHAYLYEYQETLPKVEESVLCRVPLILAVQALLDLEI